MEALKFRIAFYLLPSVSPALIAHLSSYRKRDWPTVISHLAESALIGRTVEAATSESISPMNPVSQTRNQLKPAISDVALIPKLSPEKKHGAFSKPPKE